MCNKLFVVLLVLGLVSGALADLGGDGRIMVHYTMNSTDSVGGMMMNAPEATFGGIGFANEVFLSDDGINYGPGLIGEALVIDNDGTGLDPADPNSWGMATPENGDYLDITSEVETMLYPFEDVALSMWFKQTEPLNILNHVSMWQSETHATAMPFGTHWKYYGMIKNVQDTDNPGVAPDYLSFKMGGYIAGEGAFDTGPGSSDPGKRWLNKEIPLTLDEWYHVAYSYSAEQPDGRVEARIWVNGVELHRQMVNSNSTKQPGMTEFVGLVIGGYHEESIPGYVTQIPDGMLIDDFAIISGPLNTETVADIYAIGLQGVSVENAVPEPTTIALLGLGGLALLRRKR